MDKQLIQQLKEKLEQSKGEIEAELRKFADKDTVMPDDYDTRFPGNDAVQSSDESAMRYAEYERALPVEYALELRLRSINQALDKIKSGAYGICEVCGQPIDEKRLTAFPDVKTCVKCKNSDDSPHKHKK